MLRRLTATWLRKNNATILEAGSGEEALTLAREKGATLDVIVLDVMMPGMDGFQTLEHLRGEEGTKHLPVLLLTAHANDNSDVAKVLEHASAEHMAKPYSGPALVAKVLAMGQKKRDEQARF
jgi:CheY-like chemotaxis protein